MLSAYPLPNDRWAAKDYPDLALPSISEFLVNLGYQNAIYHGGYFAYAGAGRFLKNRNFQQIFDVQDLRRPAFKALNWGIDDHAYIQPSIDFAQATKAKQKKFFISYLPITPHHPYETLNQKYPLTVPPGLKHRSPVELRKYINALNYADQVLGATINAYENAGLADDTVFIIFADHGEAFGQHRRNYNHPFYLYEENVRVPFLIYSPKLIRKAQVEQRITRHIDVLPTILDLIGIEIPGYLAGVSMLRQNPAQYAPLHTTWRNHLIGLRDQNYKYIYNKRSRIAELYDLEKDAGESKNILKSHPVIATKFKQALNALEKYQQEFFEIAIGQQINWHATQEKEEY
jgi:phosphoglycerol transferase MdoB-like AlkP superfamily enzyme